MSIDVKGEPGASTGVDWKAVEEAFFGPQSDAAGGTPPAVADSPGSAVADPDSEGCMRRKAARRSAPYEAKKKVVLNYAP